MRLRPLAGNESTIMRAAARNASSSKTVILVLALAGLIVAGVFLAVRQAKTPPIQTQGASASAQGESAPAPGADNVPRNVAPAHAPKPPAPAATTIAPALAAKATSHDPNAARVEAFAAKLLNAALPLRERTAAARELAKIGSDQAFAALKQALGSGPPSLQAQIAEALGTSPHPDAQALLASLLQNPNEEVALGAVRGLGNSGTAEAASLLSSLVQDTSKSLIFRGEVAQSLGDTQRPEALDLLTRIVHQSTDEAFTESVLSGIGKFSYDKTQAFFENYLQLAQVPVESRVAALENLQNASGNVADLLLKYVQDPDPEIRMAAARALVSTEDRGAIAGRLAGAIQQSSDPDVRASLYRALAFQDDLDLQALWPGIQQERDPGAKVAALTLAAQVTRTGDNKDMTAFFNNSVIPELKNAALAGDANLAIQVGIALRAAGTPQALDTLKGIAEQTQNPRLLRMAGVTPGAAPGASPTTTPAGPASGAPH